MHTTGISVMISAHILEVEYSTQVSVQIANPLDDICAVNRSLGVKLRGLLNVPLHLLTVSQCGGDGEGERCASITTEMFYVIHSVPSSV